MIPFFILLVASISAWGPVGHNATAEIGYNLLTSETLCKLELLYGIKGLDSFRGLANWADIVKDTPQYGWSYNLHFVDVIAKPLERCSLNYTIDCMDDRCVIGAIQNYTRRLYEEKNLDNLRFLVHFVGDIFQPFHVGYLIDKGANTIRVYYNNSHTNLHAVWDTNIIMERIHYLGNYSIFLEEIPIPEHFILTNPIDIGNFSLNTICSENLYMDNGMYIKNGYHLSDSYYEKNIEIIRQRIGYGGWYLAELLNHWGKS